MNILHLQISLDYTCGVTNHLYLISNNVNNGNKHFIMTFGGDAIQRFTEKNINVVSMEKSLFDIITFFKVYSKLKQICSAYNIDIIHSHHRYFDFITYLFAKRKGIKTVTTVHSKVDNLKAFSYKADNLIAVSESIKNNLIRKFSIDEDKIKVINNFIDQDEIKIKNNKPELLDKYNLSDEFIIGFIGRYDIEEKGIDILLKAYKLLDKDEIKKCLIFVGGGKDENYIKEFGRESNLNIKIFPPQKDIYDFINLCDIIVLPSRIDPFPYVMLEAGMMKKAFIGCNTDGIAEFIDDGKDGLLFEKENFVELSEKITLLINEEGARRKLAENLHEKVKENYSKNKLIEIYNAFYNEIINR